MRIAHISDLHFGAIASGAPEALREAVRRLAPALIVASGDLTMRGRRREFDEAAEFLESLGVPVVATPGNHDIPGWHLGMRFARPLARFRKGMRGLAAAEWRDEALVITTINSARPWGWHWNWAHGRFSRTQVREVERAFAATSPAAWHGVATHHPFEIPETMPKRFKPVGRGRRMLESMARARVDFVMCGHLHRASWGLASHMERVRGRNVLLVQASTALSTRRRGEPNAFNLIELDGDRLTLTSFERSADGEPFEAAASETFVRGEQGLRREATG